MNEVASRYGLALFSLAVDQHVVEVWQIEMKELKRIFQENAAFVTLLGSSFKTMDERLSLLDEDLQGVDDDILCFLKVIVKNNRTHYWFDIFDAFNTYCNEYRGISEGLLFTTEPLDESTIRQIEEKISRLEHGQVELHNYLDPTLIGGVKVVISGHIYDDSIKSQIEKMRQSLLK